MHWGNSICLEFIFNFRDSGLHIAATKNGEAKITCFKQYSFGKIYILASTLIPEKMFHKVGNECWAAKISKVLKKAILVSRFVGFPVNRVFTILSHESAIKDVPLCRV